VDGASINGAYILDGWLEKCTMQQLISDCSFDQPPALMKLYGTKFKYPGWETDFEYAKSLLWDTGCGFISGHTFDNHLKRNKKQAGCV